MKRSLIALAVLAGCAAPAFADPCAAATDAAMRAALDSAAAADRRTATVRVSCGGERQTLILHRSQTASGASVTVRELKRSADNTGLSGESRTSGGTSATKIIRVGQ